MRSKALRHSLKPLKNPKKKSKRSQKCHKLNIKKSKKIQNDDLIANKVSRIEAYTESFKMNMGNPPGNRVGPRGAVRKTKKVSFSEGKRLFRLPRGQYLSDFVQT